MSVPKLKAWDGSQMLDVDGIIFDGAVYDKFPFPHIIDRSNDVHELSKVVVLQSAAVHDSDGVEIFEGYVCWVGEHYEGDHLIKAAEYIVEYHGTEFILTNPNDEYCDLEHMTLNKNIHVRGHIYEHHPFCNLRNKPRIECKQCREHYAKYPIVDCDDLVLHYFPDTVKRT